MSGRQIFRLNSHDNSKTQLAKKVEIWYAAFIPKL